MAKAKIQDVLIDSAIVVGGAALMDNFLGGVEVVQNLMGNLPDVMGISLGMVVYGAVSLWLFRTYMK